MTRKKISREDAQLLASLGGILLWICIFTGVFFWSLAVWNNHVYSARHNKHWHKEYVTVVKEGIVDNVTPHVRPSYVAYYVHGQQYVANRDLSPKFHTGDSLLAYVNNHGRLWVKSAEHQWTDTLDSSKGNPFDAVKDGGPWFPTMNDVVVGGIVNAVLSMFFGLFLFEMMRQGLYTYYVYCPSVKKYWKRIKPQYVEETQRILVHTSTGELKEKEVRNRVRTRV